MAKKRGEVWHRYDPKKKAWVRCRVLHMGRFNYMLRYPKARADFQRAQP